MMQVMMMLVVVIPDQLIQHLNRGGVSKFVQLEPRIPQFVFNLVDCVQDLFVLHQVYKNYSQTQTKT